MEVTVVLCSFGLVLEKKKTGKEIADSSKLAFTEKSLEINFALAEDNTSRRGVIAYLLLLRTLLAIRQKSQEPGFWGVMDCFVLLAYESLASSGTLLSQSLPSLNFTLDSEDLPC